MKNITGSTEEQENLTGLRVSWNTKLEWDWKTKSMTEFHGEEQERLIMGPFTLVPYMPGRGKYPIAGENWALPGCSRTNPSYSSSDEITALARRKGYPIERIKVQLYRRGDGI